MKNNLNIKEKQKEYSEVIDEQYKAVRKKIGENIFFFFKVYLKEDDGYVNYYLARELYNWVLKEDTEILSLKRELDLISFRLLNNLISNEYSEILTLQRDNESLKKEVEYYKGLAKINRQYNDIRN